MARPSTSKEIKIDMSERPQSMDQAFDHLTRSMCILGVLYFSSRGGHRNLKTRRLEIFSKIMHGIVTVFVWLNFLRFFLMYSEDDAFNVDLMIRLFVHVNALKAAVAYVTCTFISKNLRGIFAAWQEYRTDYSVTERVVTSTLKRVKIATLVIWAIHALLTVSWIIMICLEMEEAILGADVILEPLPKYGVEMSMATRLAAVLLDVTLSVAMTLPIAFLICICLSLRDEFEDFNNDLKNAVKKISDLDIEYYRRWHQNIIRILSLYDDCFSLYVLITFIADVPFICACLYQGVYKGMTYFRNSILTYIYLACPMASVIYAGTQLHLSATYARFILFSLHLGELDITPKTVLQHMAFLTHLTEGHIGITGWKLFHINKETIKVVCLMIVSYTLILLKFGSVDSTAVEDQSGLLGNGSVGDSFPYSSTQAPD